MIAAYKTRKFAPTAAKQRTGSLFEDWWEWLNTKDPTVQTRAIFVPRSVADKQLESWSCPVCGAKLPRDSLHQLEIGYDIECEYCGTTINSPKMQY
jgi:DNA-directed RNA polymerase subunit RPC12/RpoP